MALYWKIAQSNELDLFILVLGSFLFLAHLWGVYERWRGKRIYFVQSLNEYREFLLLFTEILPVLGLIGTVLGLMDTLSGFEVMGSDGGDGIQSIIQRFGPAMSTTVSGLGMVGINLAANAFLWTVHQRSRTRV